MRTRPSGQCLLRPEFSSVDSGGCANYAGTSAAAHHQRARSLQSKKRPHWGRFLKEAREGRHQRRGGLDVAPMSRGNLEKSVLLEGNCIEFRASLLLIWMHVPGQRSRISCRNEKYSLTHSLHGNSTRLIADNSETLLRWLEQNFSAWVELFHYLARSDFFFARSCSAISFILLRRAL